MGRLLQKIKGIADCQPIEKVNPRWKRIEFSSNGNQHDVQSDIELQEMRPLAHLGSVIHPHPLQSTRANRDIITL